MANKKQSFESRAAVTRLYIPVSVVLFASVLESKEPLLLR